MPATDNPIAWVVLRFGSASALARELGRGQSTVSDWVVNKSVPYWQIGKIIDAGRAMEPPIELEPNDFFPPRYSKRYSKRKRTRVTVS